MEKRKIRLSMSKKGFGGLLASSLKRALGTIREEYKSSTYSYANRQDQDAERSRTSESEAYLISKKRQVEIETQKAFIVSQSRHERWKGAGGPL